MTSAMAMIYSCENNQSEKRVEYKKVEKARKNVSLFVDASCRELQKVSKNMIIISNFF